MWHFILGQSCLNDFFSSSATISFFAICLMNLIVQTLMLCFSYFKLILSHIMFNKFVYLYLFQRHGPGERDGRRVCLLMIFYNICVYLFIIFFPQRYGPGERNGRAGPRSAHQVVRVSAAFLLLSLESHLRLCASYVSI